MRENSVEQHLHKEVKKIGGVCKKTSAENASGWPDRTILCKQLKGKVILVETKTTGGYISKIQARQHNTLRAMGYFVVVLWDKGQVDALIDGILAGAYQ